MTCTLIVMTVLTKNKRTISFELSSSLHPSISLKYLKKKKKKIFLVLGSICGFEDYSIPVNTFIFYPFQMFKNCSTIQELRNSLDRMICVIYWQSFWSSWSFFLVSSDLNLWVTTTQCDWCIGEIYVVCWMQILLQL